MALFWAKVQKTDGCWLWTSCTTFGYGYFWNGTRAVRAHRFSWTLANGRKPTLDILHTCDNPPCVRPDHLYEGTDRDNSADKVARGRQYRGGVIGERNGKARLTASVVTEIRSRNSRGESLSQLGRDYGVTVQSVWAIVHRKNWKQVA